MFRTVEENNEYINERGFVGYEGEFTITFRDRKKVFFKVSYGTHGHLSQDPYFSTSAMEFNYGRTDWDRCGQAQEDLLKNRKLKEFFNKWDDLHLKVLTFDEYDELMDDIEYLKDSIPYIESDRFSDIVEFDRELSK